MPDVMKTVLLNPPSFENFDGGAGSRWPATREIESYWYPVWLTYPAGLIPGSRLVDASPHGINWRQTVEICKDYEFLVLFTSTVGFASDIKLLRKIKEGNPSLKVAFVGPHSHIKPDETLNASEDIDFVVRGEFDHAVGIIRRCGIKFAAHHEINVFTGIQSFVGLDMAMRSDKGHLERRIAFLDLAQKLDIACEPDRGSEQDEELVILADLDGLSPVNAMWRSIHQPAAG